MAHPPIAQPSALTLKLTKPSTAYRSRAWLAMLGLTGFMVLYFALSGWFLLTAYRLTFGPHANAGSGAFWGWVVGVCAAFLAVFMLKAIFFVKHGGTDGSIEVTPAQQPELFRFLNRLADQVGAPRPHKVYVSARVNAAVFYDLSLLNLFFPSKKNLEIGLGLVNALSFGELRAVLAHEFGHFAQRAMAVGRWVYVAQQIAAHLVARRDALDAFLLGLSRLDIRLAWVGWLLRVIVWSIRCLVESAFQAVLLMQRALSREMEMNADLVAVSVTGSDALIHALHRLSAADDAWARAVNFAGAELGKGKRTRDVFAIQTEIVSLMGGLLNQPDYGATPVRNTEAARAHRVFKAELAQAPQMWLTHPLNHDREANAKRHYIAAEIDPRSAWALFADAQALRAQVTAQLLDAKADAAEASVEESLQELQRQFGREFFNRRYRGIYFGRSIVRHRADPATLTEALTAPTVAELDSLYPASLAADMEQLRSLEKELEQLRALLSGALRPPGGTILHRGKALKHKQLAPTVRLVQAELTTLRERLQAHDKRCRSLHRAVAVQLGGGWADYLDGLLAALHFADHSEANLRDLQGLLGNTVAIATATRQVNAAGIANIVRDGNVLRTALAKLFEQADQVRLDGKLLHCLAAESWSRVLGELQLPGVSKENVGDWLKVVDGWVDHAASACAALRTHALEQLVLAESACANHLRQGTRPESAIAASRLPARYETLLAGAERPRQTQLNFWGRFQTADGFLPSAARLFVALWIVTAVLGLGGSVGSSKIIVYNGLARPVAVHMGAKSALQIAPWSTGTYEAPAGEKLRIETRTATGDLIESFDTDVPTSFTQYVYNVASAAPLVEWTANYGNAPAQPERALGTPRWSSTAAETLFEEPPKTIKTKGGGGTRLVLSGLGDVAPERQLDMLNAEADQKRLVATHARWDPMASQYGGRWLAVAQTSADFKTILATRLKEAPDDVLLLRLEQDGAGAGQRAAVCQRHQAQAAAAPQNANLAYVAVRCLPDGSDKAKAFLEGYARYPTHGWFALAAGYAEAESGQWQQALKDYGVARSAVPVLRDSVALHMARIQRLVQPDPAASVAELSKTSEQLSYMLALESGQGMANSPLKAYSELASGKLAQAMGASQASAAAQARLLRLAAVSDGASAAMVAQAQGLAPGLGLDAATVWASLGLAARTSANLSEFTPEQAAVTAQQFDAVLHFVAAIKSRAPAEDAERWLEGLPPELRGHAYSVGVIVLGRKAPTAWRDKARRLLFASERPYFS